MSQDSAFGVYAIANLLTGHVYIGSTTRSFSSRHKDHWTKLRLKAHKNQRLQRAWDKYGEGSFEFRVVEAVDDPDEVLGREQFHIDQHFGDQCYNLRPIAESNRGWVPSDETRLAMSRANIGRTLSDEAKRAISEKTKGLVRNQWSEESRAKLAAKKRGKSRPEAVRQKMAAANAARLEDPAYVERISAHFKTEAHKEKSRIARQKTFDGAFVAPDGRRFAGVVNLTRFCAEHNLGIPPMSDLAKGKRRQYKGWTYLGPESVRD